MHEISTFRLKIGITRKSDGFVNSSNIHKSSYELIERYITCTHVILFITASIIKIWTMWAMHYIFIIPIERCVHKNAAIPFRTTINQSRTNVMWHSCVRMPFLCLMSIRNDIFGGNLHHLPSHQTSTTDTCHSSVVEVNFVRYCAEFLTESLSELGKNIYTQMN